MDGDSLPWFFAKGVDMLRLRYVFIATLGDKRKVDVYYMRESTLMAEMVLVTGNGEPAEYTYTFIRSLFGPVEWKCRDSETTWHRMFESALMACRMRGYLI